MSNNLGQIYATSKQAEKYIILDSPNVEVSGNFLINGTNSRMPAELENSIRNYLPLTYGTTDPNPNTLYDVINEVSNNLLISNNDASFNNVDISSNLTLKGSLGVLDSSTNNIIYGNVGAVLTSNGSGSAVSWESPVVAKGYLGTYTTTASGTFYDLDLTTAFGGTYLQTTNNVTSFVAPTTGVYFVNVVMRLVSVGDKIYNIRAELRETIGGTTTLKQVYMFEPSLGSVTTDNMRQISIAFSNHLYLTATSLLSARVRCYTSDNSTWDITNNEENTSFSVHRL